MMTYPKYKVLSQKILNDIKQTGVTIPAPPIGGKGIELIKSIFGWKMARIIQFYYSKYFRK